MPDENTDAGAGKTTATEEKKDQQQDKTYTQADIDAIVKDRLGREKSKYADYDQLKTAAEELKTLKQSQMSDAEKITAKLAELESKFSDSEATRLQLEVEIAAARRETKVARIASTLGAIDAHDANILAVTGTIDATSATAEKEIQDAITALRKAKPYLFGKGVQLASFNPGDGQGPASQETDAQRRGRIYGGGGRIFDPAIARERGGGVIITEPLDKPVPK